MPRSVNRLVLLALACALVAAPSWADFRMERELELAPGGTFELDTDMGSIEVRGSSSAGARVVVTSRRDDIEEKIDFSFDESAGRVTVRADKRGRWSGWSDWRGGSLHFEVEVPRDTTLELRTAGGRIEVEEIDGLVDARTSGGSISALDLGGDADLDTSGGAISVERIAGDLKAETSGGSIRIEGAGGRVLAATSGGSVRASFARGNARGGSLSTSGGSVTAYVDPAVGLDLDVSTSGGSATVDLPVTVQGRLSRNAVRGTLNGGGENLTLRSSGGGVRVRGL